MDPALAGAARRVNAGTGPSQALPIRSPAYLAALVVVFACIALTVTFPLWDSDLWQHLAVGREIWRSGGVPAIHLWSWPTYGLTEVLPSWGFRALLWPFWNAGGVGGGFVWRWLTTLAAFALLLAAARRMGARGFAPLVVMAWAALPYAQRSQLRPETLASVLFAAQLWIHESRRAEDGADHTRWLPLIALLWANVHISWWIGLAVQAIYFADAWWSRRSGTSAPLARLAVIGALSGAASLVNPFGWRALAQPFEYWFRWRHEPIFQTISELQPVDWAANVRNLLPLLVVVWPVLLFVRARRRGLDLAELLLAALFLTLALGTQRFAGFLALAAAPFVARDLDEWIRARRWPAWTSRASVGAAIAMLLAVLGSLPQWTDPAEPRGFGLDARAYPAAACDFIERETVRGRSFNDFQFGGYLLWRFPGERDRLPFMDIHQSGTREERRLYALASTRGDAWRELDRRHRFDWVLLNRRHLTDQRSLDIADADTAFALVFADDVAALYVRREGPLRALAARAGYRWLHAGSEAAARTREAAADPARRPDLAAEIERLIASSPQHAGGLLLRSNLEAMDGDLPAALSSLRAALEVDPDFPFANERLAVVALELGHAREAERAIQREIGLQGKTPRLRDLLARARALPRETRRD